MRSPPCHAVDWHTILRNNRNEMQYRIILFEPRDELSGEDISIGTLHES